MIHDGLISTKQSSSVRDIVTGQDPNRPVTRVWIDGLMRKAEGLDASGNHWSMATPLTDEEERIATLEGYDPAQAVNCHVFAGECKLADAHRAGCMVLTDAGVVLFDGKSSGVVVVDDELQVEYTYVSGRTS